jgi:tetratricopeptide (TPR) repeat protein
MTRRLALALAALASAAGAQSVHQTTSGWCSPTVADTKGNVQITCNGVDPAALKRLNELLDKKDLELSQKTAEAEDWSHKYQELQQQLAAKGASSEDARQTQQLVREGRFEQAGELLDKRIESGGSDLAQLAADHYARAQTDALQFKPLAALPHYEQAYRDQPDNPTYALAYANLLAKQNRFSEAEPVYRAAVAGFRRLAQSEPDADRPLLARALDGLGTLYKEMHRLPEAEKALSEALQIRRELADTDPDKSGAMAGSLNNLANVFLQTQRRAQAESAYQEALRIFRKSGNQINAAVALGNLSTIYLETGRLEEARKADEEAVGIWRDVVQKKSTPEWQSRLARALEQLGDSRVKTKQWSEAEQVYKEALEIQRKLAQDNPGAYVRRVGDALGRFGQLYEREQRYDEAERAYADALEIRRRLAAEEPENFSLALIGNLNHMGLLYQHTQRPAKAERAYREALQISRQMSLENAAAYLPETRQVLVNLGNLLRAEHRGAEANKAFDEAGQIANNLKSP